MLVLKNYPSWAAATEELAQSASHTQISLKQTRMHSGNRAFNFLLKPNKNNQSDPAYFFFSTAFAQILFKYN